MTLHEIAVFLHIVGALLLFGAQAIEVVGFDRLRQAPTAEAVLGALSFLRPLPHIYQWSGITLLVTGLYLTFAVWGWHAWIVVSLVLFLALATAGPAILGPRMGPLAQAAAASPGPIGPDLAVRINDSFLVVSFYVRCAVSLGIVLLMVTKPSLLTAVITFVVAAVMGFVAGRIVNGRKATVRVTTPS